MWFDFEQGPTHAPRAAALCGPHNCGAEVADDPARPSSDTGSPERLEVHVWDGSFLDGHDQLHRTARRGGGERERRRAATTVQQENS